MNNPLPPKIVISFDRSVMIVIACFLVICVSVLGLTTYFYMKTHEQVRNPHAQTQKLPQSSSKRNLEPVNDKGEYLIDPLEDPANKFPPESGVNLPESNTPTE